MIQGLHLYIYIQYSIYSTLQHLQHPQQLQQYSSLQQFTAFLQHFYSNLQQIQQPQQLQQIQQLQHWQDCTAFTAKHSNIQPVNGQYKAQTAKKAVNKGQKTSNIIKKWSVIIRIHWNCTQDHQDVARMKWTLQIWVQKSGKTKKKRS